MRRIGRLVSIACLALIAPACNEDGSITVRKISFEGVHGIDESQLKAALATRENATVPLVGWQIPWGRKSPFDETRFKTDLQRITAFYADRGYPNARVVGFDVTPNARQDAVEIQVRIDEGQPVIVAAVDLAGFEVVPADHLATLRNNLPLKVGKPRDRQVLLAAHEMALNELRDHGYPYAKVDTREDDGVDGKSATIHFTAQPGTLAHFGPIEIQGNTTVSERIIAREVLFKPGDLYQRSVVQNSQRRLYQLELFQFVNIEATNKEDQLPEVPMRITVAEGKHQRVHFGAGYGSDEKGRVDAEYNHVNFLGAARSAGVHARYSSLDRGVRAEFTQPYFFRKGLSLTLLAQQWYTYTPAYQSEISAANAAITQKFGTQTSLSFSITNERSSSTISEDVRNDPTLIDDLIALGFDPSTGKQEGTLTALGVDFRRSTADSLLNATRGYQIALHVEEAGIGLPGTYNYYAATIDGRHYVSFADRFVLASRIQLGNIDAIGQGDVSVPFSKKFFLGGSSSLRGWGRFEVSPLSSSGVPLGGNSLLSFSEELRAPITDKLGFVAFLDAGNVWTDSWGIKLDDLRYAIGPGLRYQTPVGPIRFDIGYQLNPIPGLLVNGEPQTRRVRFHFSIGQAF
jgi:outer membrane protein insertion porin family/translocation and assembly module TamA